MTISGSKLCSAVHFTVSSGLIWDWRVLGRDQNFNHKSIKNIDAEGPKCLVFTSAIYQSLQNAIEESKLMYHGSQDNAIRTMRCLLFQPGSSPDCTGVLALPGWKSKQRNVLIALSCEPWEMYFLFSGCEQSRWCELYQHEEQAADSRDLGGVPWPGDYPTHHRGPGGLQPVEDWGLWALDRAVGKTVWARVTVKTDHQQHLRLVPPGQPCG